MLVIIRFVTYYLYCTIRDRRIQVLRNPTAVLPVHEFGNDWMSQTALLVTVEVILYYLVEYT